MDKLKKAKPARCPSCQKKMLCNAKARIASEKLDLVVIEMMDKEFPPDQVERIEVVLREAIAAAESMAKLEGRLRDKLLHLL